MTYRYRWPRPSLTVDCVILGFDPAGKGLRVLLVQRAADPFAGAWALPGGFVQVSDEGDQGESLEDAARRELREETGIRVAYLEQLYTFGAPGRDPRGRVVSVAYVALVRQTDHAPNAGSDARAAAWHALDDVLAGEAGKLAFDHKKVLKLAAERIRAKVRYAPIGFNLLPSKFTLGDLHKLYEAVSGRTLDVSNFHKKVARVLVPSGIVVRTGELLEGRHRPAPLYAFDARAYERALDEGFVFEI